MKRFFSVNFRKLVDDPLMKLQTASAALHTNIKTLLRNRWKGKLFNWRFTVPYLINHYGQRCKEWIGPLHPKTTSKCNLLRSPCSRFVWWEGEIFLKAATLWWFADGLRKENKTGEGERWKISSNLHDNWWWPNEICENSLKT